MNIGLYFGSFNPIHIGHLIIANHVLEHTDLDKIWFVVTPQNPLKESNSLLNEYDRLHLVNIAIKDNPKFRASNVEFHLPRPSFTIDTLTYLSEKFPLEKFSLILGGDSFQNISRWKNYEQLLNNYSLLIYNRPGCIIDKSMAKHAHILDAPLLEISSSFVRKQIKEHLSIKYLVTDEVEQYIKENSYYL